MRVRRQTIARIVTGLLQESGVKQPPVPVEAIAEHLGLEVKRTPGPDDLSGFLLRDTATGHSVIGVNSSHHSNRQRFTVAHEIGHYVLHDGEPLHIDALANYRVERRSSVSSAGTQTKEVEANAFAAELLMPEAFLRRDIDRSNTAIDLSDDTSISELADRYAVSVSAMTYRLGNLGFIRV